MIQLDLPTAYPLTGAYHPVTSFEAAEKIEPHLSSLQSRVYNYIAAKGKAGATDHEIQDRLEMGESTERPRRIELRDLGLVVDSGQRRDYYGHKGIVWMVKAEK